MFDTRLVTVGRRSFEAPEAVNMLANDGNFRVPPLYGRWGVLMNSVWLSGGVDVQI